MKVTIYEDKCIGSGQCVMIASEVFDQNDEGIVVLLDENPPSSEQSKVLQAARICPTSVITVME